MADTLVRDFWMPPAVRCCARLGAGQDIDLTPSVAGYLLAHRTARIVPSDLTSKVKGLEGKTISRSRRCGFAARGIRLAGTRLPTQSQQASMEGQSADLYAIPRPGRPRKVSPCSDRLAQDGEPSPLRDYDPIKARRIAARQKLAAAMLAGGNGNRKLRVV